MVIGFGGSIQYSQHADECVMAGQDKQIKTLPLHDIISGRTMKESEMQQFYR